MHFGWSEEATLMSEVQTASAVINGINLRYAVEGPADAPAVVLHHPLATNLAYWDELAAALGPRYRVLRFDARGHGQSDAPVGRYSFETLADDVVALMDHVGITCAAYVGLSMGGMVGQVLGLRHPERFKALIIASATSRIAAESRQLWVDRVGVARAQGMGSQVAPAMARWVAETTKTNNPALVARFAQMIEATPLEGYAGWCGAIEHLDLTDRLAGIALPVRVIVGALDPATPVAASEAIHRAIPGSDIVIVPGVSHMLSSEDPAAFHAAVLPFLARYIV
jgi:3-oxoadipate enol-lactonase